MTPTAPPPAATPAPAPNDLPALVDVAVVGGGAAGLSGALTLGRARRRVVVLDAGEQRNAPAAGVHGYLGREGVTPADLYADARAELAAYAVPVVTARVEQVRPWDRPGTGFLLTTADGRTVEARRLLLATGLVDELPDLPGVREHWGRGVLHCPYCHGWEVRDQRLVVVATSGFATHQALLWRQWTDRLVLVVDPALTPAPTEEDRERLAARGVEVVDVEHGGVAAVEGEPGDLRGVRLADGRLLAADAVVCAGRMVARSDLLEQLGVPAEEFERGGVSFGAVVTPGPMGTTAVPGVAVAGNVADLAAQVVVAAGQGLQAGAALNADLVEEDTAAALDQARGAWFEQPWWEERYAARGPVWSGHVNAAVAAEVAAAEAGGLRPGRALDVGAGEGGDALWLAERGWQVTAVDFAEAGLAKVRDAAAARGLADRVEPRWGDARTFEPGEERWDLVSSAFLHLPDGGMVDVVRRLASAVAPGGTLLVVGHHPDDLATGLRHGRAEWLFTPDELVGALDPDAWEVRTEVRDRLEGGHQHGDHQHGDHDHDDHDHDDHDHGDHGPTAVRDSVLVARRR